MTPEWYSVTIIGTAFVVNLLLLPAARPAGGTT